MLGNYKKVFHQDSHDYEKIPVNITKHLFGGELLYYLIPVFYNFEAMD